MIRYAVIQHFVNWCDGHNLLHQFIDAEDENYQAVSIILSIKNDQSVSPKWGTLIVWDTHAVFCDILGRTAKCRYEYPNSIDNLEFAIVQFFAQRI